MIVTRKKPAEELLEMLGGVTKVALVGCGSCATASRTGGEIEMTELEAFLKEQGIEVVFKCLPDESCQMPKVKKEVKLLAESGAEAVISMGCGDGVQTVAELVPLPVYPANNTMFLGQVERVGIFNEECRMCGDCVLGSTGGICPITHCAKSLVNGPCGGQKNGKCEVNPDNPCAWIEIYNRLESLGQLDKLTKRRPDKGYSSSIYPKRVNLREERK